jgi:hypothetical protein
MSGSECLCDIAIVTRYIVTVRRAIGSHKENSPAGRGILTLSGEISAHNVGFHRSAGEFAPAGVDGGYRASHSA